MLLLASILLVGIVLGLVLGGRLSNLAGLQIRWWPLFPAALLLQALRVPRADEGIGAYVPFLVLLLSFLVIGFVCALNVRLPGFAAILLGVVLNAIPIAVNQGMPVSAEAVESIGREPADVDRERGEKHHLLGPEDSVTFLADVIPVPAPFTMVISVGDVVMWLGAGWFVTAATSGRGRRPSPRPSTAESSPPDRSSRRATRSGSPR